MFQRRRNGSENFYRGWVDYENGFGNVKGEHWLGLKKISCLTSVGVTKLRIDLIDFAGHSKFAYYDYFHVGTASTNYRLTIGGYQNWGIGAAGDSMTRYILNGMPFTTHDRDGSENFFRGWADYENGFGNIKGEYWLGLKKISCLTSVEVKTKLRVDLADFAGHSKFAYYDHFHVGNPSSNYKLTIGGYQHWGLGVAGDSFTRDHSLNGMSFVTETMIGTVALTVLCMTKEPGGTTRVPTLTSMDCTSMIRATAMVSHGGISMLLMAHAHFDIQT